MNKAIALAAASIAASRAAARTAPLAPAERHGFIDSIRGIAAMAVVYLHMAERLLREHDSLGPLEAGVLWLFTDVVDAGKVGVATFFAVSGFVIPFSLLSRSRRPVLRFALTRLFRLYPAYWLSIALGVLFVWHLHERPIDTLTIAMNATMLQQFFGVPNVLGLYWTLQIELLFYASCVVLFIAGRLQQPRTVFTAAVLLLAAALAGAAVRAHTGVKLPLAVPLGLALMFWGTLWRQHVLDHDCDCRRLGVRFLGVFIVALPLIALLGYNRDMGHGETWYRYTLSYYAAAALLVLLTGPVKLEQRLFRWLGRISYSVYLFHPIVMSLFFFLVPARSVQAMPAHATILAVMALTAFVAHIAYLAVERPFIALGRKAVRTLQAERA